MYFRFIFTLVLIFSFSTSPAFFENSFAQQEISPHDQWKKFADLDTLICKQGHLLLQKNNGNPACVLPFTYLKLIDRGYGAYDSSIMSKHPEMMNQLMQNMASNDKLMYHWHEMLQKNSSMMMQTVNNLVSQIKDNPELLKNMLGPMTSDPKLREKMIEIMKNHSQMENSLKQNTIWMDSVHQTMMSSGMEQGMHNITCTWCPDYQINANHEHFGEFVNSDRMMDVIHHMWINSEMTQDMHVLMMKNPSHMAQMSEHMMEPMLEAIMDDANLRQQMIDLMLEHPDFMNTIRHNNPVK
jgi:hypothetical protein